MKLTRRVPGWWSHIVSFGKPLARLSQPRSVRIPAARRLGHADKPILEQLEDRTLLSEGAAFGYSPADASLTCTGADGPMVSFTQSVTVDKKPSGDSPFGAELKVVGAPAGVGVSTSPATLTFGPDYPDTESWVVRFDIASSVGAGTYEGIKIKANAIGSSVAESSGTTVAITVGARCHNTAPVASDDSASVDEDTALAVAAPGVLANDIDAESDALTAVLVAAPAHAASFALASDGSFTYTPARTSSDRTALPIEPVMACANPMWQR